MAARREYCTATHAASDANIAEAPKPNIADLASDIQSGVGTKLPR